MIIHILTPYPLLFTLYSIIVKILNLSYYINHVNTNSY